MDTPRIGVLTISDRAHQGVYQDLGGPAILTALQDLLAGSWEPISRLVPDDQTQIASALRELCDVEGCCLVLTTGGTGIAPRDVTPEATLAVGERELPGFGERMRAVSSQIVLTAILSRQTAVIRGHSLILNLPGKPKAIRECLDAVFAAIPDCVDQIGGPKLEVTDKVKAYRH
ncbi:molybdopterin adenylyltransferase [Holophaga foetida]|uniref:molybdopterin adenylyltransferase n=1 Tax=Holophaga foetida TaxID=35839 RepID=UPI0002473308|nr:molybdopterin adenylyltransferase [Holophaga foetida]